MEHRIQKLRQLLKEEKIPALYITNPYNLRYMTGFTGTSGTALITMEHAYFITDFRYVEQAHRQCQGYHIIQHQGQPFAELAPLLNEEGIEELGFDDHHLTFAQYMDLQQYIEGYDLIPVSGLIESLREVKDESEIAIIKEACHIADQAFSHILDYIQPGMSEIQVANELDFYMRSKGASGISFDTIVASGVRSAMPHGVASDKIIEKGDFITLDFGCYYQGYVSDMTRTISLGEPKKAVLKEIYQIVLDAHLAVEQAAKPGVTGKELDAVARQYITDRGYGEYFGHSTGHGIGLEIHEAPMISKMNDCPLVTGNTITDEPGIYLPNIGGVRIENDLLLTNDGCEVLTKSDRQLLIL